MKKIGLFFGSFNPVHVGHMIIANHLVEHTNLDEVWMVVSPQNPFKLRKNLAGSHDRLHLLNLAIGEANNKIKASDIEFSLPIPSYTVDTLAYLKEKYENYDFSLIMGGDNLVHFHKWKNYKTIIDNHSIYVYKRPGSGATSFDDHHSIQFVNAPLLDISSSFIRNEIRENRSVEYLLLPNVYEYLKSSNMYK